MDIGKKVKEIVSSASGVGVDELNDNTSFENDLGLDVLDITEIIMCVEEEFAINITASDEDLLTTVGKLVEYVAERKSAKG